MLAPESDVAAVAVAAVEDRADCTDKPKLDAGLVAVGVEGVHYDGLPFSSLDTRK